MGSPLPAISRTEFVQRLTATGLDAVGSVALRPGWAGLLWQHYEEMRRWNPKLSLVGPGTADEVVERHYVESLRVLPLLGDLATGLSPKALVDVGTGGGFPGLVLAAACAELDVVLVEANQRKCAFLNAALRRLRKAADEASGEAQKALSCRVLGARVERPEDATSGWPESVDVVTSRAVAWTSDLHQSLQSRWPTVRFLLWIGREFPRLPSADAGRQVSLGSGRRIVEILSAPPRYP